jgi:cytochrome c oxidase subunit II
MSAANIESGNVPQAEPRHLLRVAVIWFVLSVLGVAGTLVFMPLMMPTSASETSRFANLTIVVFTAAAIPVALFVWVFLGYSLVVFRVRERPTEDGPRLQPTRITQIAWLGITGVLCLFLLVWGLLGIYQQTAAAAPHPLTVKVTGQQWTWTYSYPDNNVSSHTLELPVNRAIRFQVTSLDVLHGFAIDQLGVRMDANPNQVVTLPLVTPSRLGSYDTRCVEFCGLYHSYMYTPVKVVTAQAFSSWIKQQGGHV